MSSQLDIIKSYVVDVGFNIDSSGLGSVNTTMQNFFRSVQPHLSLVTKMFQDMGAGILSVSAAIGSATAGLLDQLGNQQIHMQILSREFWTSTQNAMAFSEALNVLHTNVQGLYLSPTLLSQYQQLYALGKQLQTPGNYAQTIQGIQNIQLQFREMQVEAYYALQWIGYYFTRYMTGPLSNMQNVLQNLNLTIQKNMPTWTANVAKFLVGFTQFWQAAWQIVSSVGSTLVQVVSSVPGWAKVVAAAIGVISLAMNSTPFGRFIEAFTAVVLLFQDFQTWKKGGKSAFGGLWSELSKLQGAITPILLLLRDLALAWAANKVLVGGLTIALRLWQAALNIAKFAVIAFTNVMKLVRLAMIAFNLVADANPFALIILSVGVLIFLLVKIITHIKQVKTAFVDMGNAIKGLFGADINWIVNQFNRLIKLIDKIPGVKIPLIPTLSVSPQAKAAVAAAASGIANSPIMTRWGKRPSAAPSPSGQNSSTGPVAASQSYGGAPQAPFSLPNLKIPLAGTRVAGLLNGLFSPSSAINSRTNSTSYSVNHNNYNIDGRQNVTITSTGSADSVAKAINNAQANHLRMVGAVIQGG